MMKSKEEAGNKTRVEIGRSIKEKRVWKSSAETGLIWGLEKRSSKRLRHHVFVCLLVFEDASAVAAGW